MSWWIGRNVTVPTDLPRRLPVVPLPVAGESFSSWVDHLAYTYEVDRITMMRRLGMEAALGQRKGASYALELIRCTGQMPSAVSTAVAAATGLTGIEIGAMLPNVSIKSAAFPKMSKETWAFCPKCLAPDGRWPLWWFEPWAVACPVHRCYLVSFCPRCGAPFTPHRTSSRWGSPGGARDIATRSPAPTLPGSTRTLRPAAVEDRHPADGQDRDHDESDPGGRT